MRNGTRGRAERTRTSGVERAVAATAVDLESIDPESPLLLDFDETYWLRNSTEAFLARVRPAWPAALLLAALDGLKLGGCCRPGPSACLARLAPGAPGRRALALVVPPLADTRCRAWPEMAEPSVRPAPLVARASVSGTWIVTNGFRPIVAPLLAALPEAERPTLLASPLWTGFAWRRRGKLEVVEAALGADRLATATVVTDNDEDGDLLAAARTTLYLKWPAARFEPAHAEAYLLFF